MYETKINILNLISHNYEKSNWFGLFFNLRVPMQKKKKKEISNKYLYFSL